jgi:multidrug resistance efflux pump
VVARRVPGTGCGVMVGVKEGKVIATHGDTLAEVIPISDKLVLSAKINPTDINNVAVGQTAEVRFPAFSYKHLPAIFGDVRSVSADSLVDDESPTKAHYYSAKVVIDQKDSVFSD